MGGSSAWAIGAEGAAVDSRSEAARLLLERLGMDDFAEQAKCRRIFDELYARAFRGTSRFWACAQAWSTCAFATGAGSGGRRLSRAGSYTTSNLAGSRRSRNASR